MTVIGLHGAFLRALDTPGLTGRGHQAFREAVRPLAPEPAVYKRVLDELVSLGLVRLSKMRVVPTDATRDYLRSLRSKN